MSENQIKQAVKKSIADYPERAEGLVEEYRSINCGVNKSKAVKNQAVTQDSIKAIPSQAITCKQLIAKGINNIEVANNMWAKSLDRDNDGIACESR
ncbi:MAG: excalibur calcium-binding domain-containing protein [Rivularia sp. ALOHA_DT_140]|nr:excalibur calcium-binding domain-containing protein [Rivularia sp. ALOHA_DT_140]